MKKILFVILAFNFTTLAAHASQVGQEYFNAIVFGDGPMADQIDEIKKNYHIDLYTRNELEKSDIRGLSKEMINQIELANPGYFDLIESTMKTENPVLVSRMVNDVYSKAYSTLKLINPKLEVAEKMIAADLAGNRQAFTVAAAVVAVAAAAVHNVVAVTSMAAVVVAVKIKLAVDARGYDRPRRELEKEKMIKSLIKSRQY